MNKDILEKSRLKIGPYSSKNGDNYGCFFIKYKNKLMKVICSPLGVGKWDHVSVSMNNKCPSWEDMCYIKDLFWDEEQTVIQFHPKKSEYVNNHPYCLHLWKNNHTEHLLPESFLVGIKK